MKDLKKYPVINIGMPQEAFKDMLYIVERIVAFNKDESGLDIMSMWRELLCTSFRELIKSEHWATLNTKGKDSMYFLNDQLREMLQLLEEYADNYPYADAGCFDGEHAAEAKEHRKEHGRVYGKLANNKEILKKAA